MPTRPLELVLKETVLRALVEANYDVDVASRELAISKSTIYKKLRRWQLTPPMFAHKAGGQVLRKDFADRCLAIREALSKLG